MDPNWKLRAENFKLRVAVAELKATVADRESRIASLELTNEQNTLVAEALHGTEHVAADLDWDTLEWRATPEAPKP